MVIEDLYESKMFESTNDGVRIECENDFKDELANYIKSVGGQINGMEDTGDFTTYLVNGLAQQTLDEFDDHPKIAVVNGAGLREESPYGMIDRIKDTTIGKAKGLVGGGQTEAGNKQAGQKANQIFKKFKSYVGRVVGKGQSEVESSVLVDFLNSMGMDSSDVPQGFLTPKEAGELIFKSVRKGYRTPQSSQSSQPQAQVKKPVSLKTEPTKQSQELKTKFSNLSKEEREQLLSLLNR